MASFSRNLDETLHRAIALATERSHELATLEHLLLALTTDQDAAAVMRACNVDLDLLRRNLFEFIENELANLKAELPDQPNCRAIVAAIVGLAHGLDIDVTAEGVETADQLAVLKAAGCTNVQGYYFARPRPLAEIDLDLDLDLDLDGAGAMPSPRATRIGTT